jgi:hypothetical protein
MHIADSGKESVRLWNSTKIRDLNMRDFLEHSCREKSIICSVLNQKTMRIQMLPVIATPQPKLLLAVSSHLVAIIF